MFVATNMDFKATKICLSLQKLDCFSRHKNAVCVLASQKGSNVLRDDKSPVKRSFTYRALSLTTMAGKI